MAGHPKVWEAPNRINCQLCIEGLELALVERGCYQNTVLLNNDMAL